MGTERVYNKIRDLRHQRGVTQAELAGAVGVSRQTIISIESGRYIPSLPLALKLSAYFQCSTDALFSLAE